MSSAAAATLPTRRSFAAPVATGLKRAALVAAVLAALAFRRVRWAWYALVISTTGVIGICVLGSIGSLFLLVPLAGAAAAISMLVRPEVRHWFGLR